MRKFVIKIFLFAILFSISLSPLYLYFTYYEKMAHTCNTVSPYRQINRIHNMKDMDANVIVTGNSRAEGSYNDSILSDELGIKCINIGWSGYPFVHQYHVMLKTYFSQNKKPDYIIQEIGPWAFLDHVNPIYSLEMFPYLNQSNFHFLEEICPEITKWDRFIMIRYIGKLAQIYNEILYIKGIEKKYPIRYGFKSNYIKKKQALERDSTILNLFKNYIIECKENNIELIFVCSPIHILEGQRFFDMDGFWSIFNKIAKENNIMILNYQNLYGNDTTYFANSMHLNKYGRDCFSHKIAHDLDSLNIISARHNRHIH